MVASVYSHRNLPITAAPVYPHRDLPLSAARRQKHLAFAAAYLNQAKIDIEAGAEASAEWCMTKRRQHQQSLADIRAARANA